MKEKKLKYTQSEYEDYILNNFNFEVMSEYKGSMYPVKMKHVICGGISNRTTDQAKKNGCPYCNGSMLLRGFNDLSITNAEVYKLLTDKNDIFHIQVKKHRLHVLLVVKNISKRLILLLDMD